MRPIFKASSTADKETCWTAASQMSKCFLSDGVFLLIELQESPTWHLGARHFEDVQPWHLATHGISTCHVCEVLEHICSMDTDITGPPDSQDRVKPSSAWNAIVEVVFPTILHNCSNFLFEGLHGGIETHILSPHKPVCQLSLLIFGGQGLLESNI